MKLNLNPWKYLKLIMLKNFEFKKFLKNFKNYEENSEMDIIGTEEKVFEEKDGYMNRVSLEIYHNSSRVHKEVIGVYWKNGKKLKERIKKKAKKRANYMKEIINENLPCESNVYLAQIEEF